MFLKDFFKHSYTNTYIEISKGLIIPTKNFCNVQIFFFYSSAYIIRNAGMDVQVLLPIRIQDIKTMNFMFFLNVLPFFTNIMRTYLNNIS